MRKRCLCGLLAAAMLATAFAASHAQAACWQGDQVQTVRGRLTVGRFVDANDRPERPFILRLEKPVCLTDATLGDVDDTRTIHVFAADARLQAQLRRRVGTTIVVRGKPFARHTAHHHAPIVMDVSAIASR